MAKTRRKTTTKTVARRGTPAGASARSVQPVVVRVQGKRLGRDLRPGRRPRRMSARAKVNLLRSVAPQLTALGLWDYAHLTARQPWIENVARLAVIHASMRSNPNDFTLSASDGDYHEPYARVYFLAPKANVPILIDFLVNALVPQTVDTDADSTAQSTTLTAGVHHVSIVLVPQTANHLYAAGLRTQRGDASQPLLRLEAIELTTLS